ncbi:MAG: AAA family ATPase [Fibrobacterota bacterium]
MNVNEINSALLSGYTEGKGLFPHLERLEKARFRFNMDFGLATLPEEPGILLVRGARQYGKSTWLEGCIRDSIIKFGPGCAFYLNGDFSGSDQELEDSIRGVCGLYPVASRVRRLFIDEITAVKGWQKVLKRLWDSGDLENVLVITTGSKASDLMRGTERLPGRKGRLSRTTYLFTPVPFHEFNRVCGEVLGGETLDAYALTGGCPAACSEIAGTGALPAYIVEMIRDWIFGEFAAAERNRTSLIHVVECIIRRGGTPLGQYKLAKEAGLANNTLAAEYTRLLVELLCVGRGFQWDARTDAAIPRKPEKIHFINTLVAAAFHPAAPRSPAELRALSPEARGAWHEWIVAQELWRRAAIAGAEIPEQLPFWGSKEHEIDFINDRSTFLEVKSGLASPMEFTWFQKTFPKKSLKVVNAGRFDAGSIQGIPLMDFLMEAS